MNEQKQAELDAEYAEILATLPENPTPDQILEFTDKQLFVYERHQMSLNTSEVEVAEPAKPVKETKVKEVSEEEIAYRTAYAQWLEECKAIDERREFTKEEWRKAVSEAKHAKENWDVYVATKRDEKDAAQNAKKPPMPLKKQFLRG